ncbi:plakophilin-2 [Denticeps clupeoides]|uniref:Plakophilin-2 n=1 Tax=Denticeps clupeoides TaxID=299321 RepID=A0AAY4DE39_9TELE|nr:plakophilin-2 [Denticeps clupeoides]
MARRTPYLKSALPGRGSPDAEDTSLALPAEDQAGGRSRGVRVQQQVQLTLSRRAKKHVHGCLQPSSSLSSGWGTANGHTSHTEDSSLRSLRKPFKRVDVSPELSPELPRARLAFGTLRYRHRSEASGWRDACYTLPTGRAGPTNGVLTAARSHHHIPSEFARGSRHASMRDGLDLLRDDDDNVFLVNSPYETAFPAEGRRMARAAPLDAASQATLSRSRSIQSRSLAWLNQGQDPPSPASMEADSARALPLGAQEAPEKKSGEAEIPLTIERAVNLLPKGDDAVQIYAAGFLQNQCFSSAEAKKMVYYLHGIPKLLALLRSDSEELVQVASGALRNAVFESNENKMEMRDCEGMPVILQLLARSRDTETRRQITGLLWNLSSHDLLKDYLTREALDTLATSVLVPCSGINEGENPKEDLLADPEVFYNATGCLRNVSSAGPDGRKAMRDCEGLIDSLVYYVRGTIADYESDDQSTENCVCILHNLSYQIEAELPQRYAMQLHQPQHDLIAKAKTPGCFSVKSSKIAEQTEVRCPLLDEKANPCGVEWLWSGISVRMYLSLIARSSRMFTQEASIGALQNLTAGNGPISVALAHTIVLREGGLQQIQKMLQAGEPTVRRTTVSLLRNLSRYKELHGDIVKQALPDLVALLPNPEPSSDRSSDATVSLCHVLINLCQSETQHVRTIINNGALPKIISLSADDNGFGPTRTAQAARNLLHSMWSHSELHAAYRKAGYKKADFIKNRSLKAANSTQD